MMVTQNYDDFNVTSINPDNVLASQNLKGAKNTAKPEDEFDVDKLAAKISAYVAEKVTIQNDEKKALLVKTSQLAYKLSRQNYFDNTSALACLAVPLIYEVANAKWEEFLSGISADIVPVLKAYQMMPELKHDLDYKYKLAESIKQLLVASSKDFRVIFLRIAYWYAQLKLINNLNLEKAQSLAEETLQIYAPIVHRLGIYRIKVELEKLSFKFLEPKIYQQISDFVASLVDKKEGFYQQIGQNFAKIIKPEKVGYEFSYRTKDIYSIHKKAKQRNVEFSQLYDLIACRIIVNNISDCYQILGLVHKYYKPLPGRFKDYINQPKANGYQSLHTTVVNDEGIIFEVQIRTHKMHANSEYGLAAHWNYKEKNKRKLESADEVKWLRKLLSNFDEKTDLTESLQQLKRELYSNNIYVFTPNGKMIALPVGSTLLDFAYHIHSQIGNSCMGGKINGHFSSIKTKLENGQQIEIVTSTTSKPNAGWLKICVTNRALGHIRSAIKRQSMFEAEKIGYKSLNKALDTVSIPTIEKAEKHPLIIKYLRKKSFTNFADLLKAIGFGNVDPNDVVNYIKYFDKPENKKSGFKKLFKIPKINFNSKGFKTDASKNELLQGIPTRLASCCQPTQGDELVAFIDNSKVLKIHQIECENVDPKRVNPAQLLHINWDFESDKNILVRIHFDFEKQISNLNQITKVLTALNVNIKEANTKILADGKMRFSIFAEISQIQTIQKIKDKFKKTRHIKVLTDRL